MSQKNNLPLMNPVSGFSLGTTCAGIKVEGRKDLVVMSFAAQANVAGVFTQNAFCAAPVHVAKDHLKKNNKEGDSRQFFVVNTGNANAGTGDQGMLDAEKTCQIMAELADSDPLSVLPFSTGVIGESLPIEKIISALPDALNNVAEDGWSDAAEGILTTDTRTKGASAQLEIDGEVVTITGISKGSGMICPDMATMLCFVATDASIAQPVLQKLLQFAADHSFNRITVDGDTSTNDAGMLVATGRAMGQAMEKVIDSETHPQYLPLRDAITDIYEQLAKAIVLDGEGATKLITIQIQSGLTEQECLDVAYTIAHSPLVKTAFFASDPNWGRILAAVGRAGVDALDINALEIFLDDVCLVRQGGRAEDYTEEQGQLVMNRDQITVKVNLNRGSASAQIWTCDLSYDYVKINAEYRT